MASGKAGRNGVARLFPLFLLGYLLVCLAAALVSFHRRPSGLISSDGKGYYAWLRSLAIDGDLDFANDYRLLYPPEPLPPQMEQRTPRGLVPDKYPVGVAVVETPGFLAGHVVALALGEPADGVSPPYQLAITIWLQLVCIAGAWALYLALLRLGVRDTIAALTVVSVLLATNVVHYIASPTMSHGPGFALLCFAVLATLLARDDASVRAMALAGALLGLAAVVRPTNLALAPFFLVYLGPMLKRARLAWPFAAAFVLPVLLQVLLMSLVWGELRLNGYTDETFSAGFRGIAGTLVSARHGLFPYHPWYALALGVSVAATRRATTRATAIGALLSFVLLTIANGTWSTWWFGDSFGNRAFIEIIPALAVVIALWLETTADAARRTATLAFASATLVASAANVLLWTGFILHRYPASGAHTISQAYLWPMHR